MHRTLTLEYPITRSFGSRILAPISYTGAFIVIIFLTVINVALVGYETITVFQSDFNATQSLWYDKFLPYKTRKPGTLCEPHVFNVGESITTNYTLFKWNIEAIVQANAGKSGVSYNGSVLDTCDISDILFTGDLRTWSAEFVVVALCQAKGKFDVVASTSMSLSALPGNRSPMLGLVRSLGTDLTATTIFNLLLLALNDLGDRAWAALLASNRTGPVMMSYAAQIEPCPAPLGITAPCATSSPRFNYTISASVMADGSVRQNVVDAPAAPQPLILDDVFMGPMTNFAELIWAAVRVDLGNPSPNNFLLFPDRLNQTLIAEFPATALTSATGSALYAAWASPFDSPDTLPGYVPVAWHGPASLQVVYLCHFQQRKGPGSLVVSVLVATLSMFSTGWAIFLLVVTYFAKKDTRAANHCEGCKQELDSVIEFPEFTGGMRRFSPEEEARRYEPEFSQPSSQVEYSCLNDDRLSV